MQLVINFWLLPPSWQVPCAYGQNPAVQFHLLTQNSADGGMFVLFKKEMHDKCVYIYTLDLKSINTNQYFQKKSPTHFLKIVL